MVGKPLVAAAAVAVLACSRYAAPTENWQTRVNQLVASGDTAGALARLDTAVARHPRDAAAWHRMGMLAWEQIRPHWHGKVSHPQPHIQLMARADSALRLAHAHAPDSGRYALDLGRYFLFGGLITLRVQALGKFELAVDAARRVGDSALVSEAADEIGMAFWRRYEAVAHRRLITTGVNTFPVFALDERRAVKDWLQNSTQQLPEPSGQLDYLKATDWFHIAQAADPRAERPARHIFMALAEQEQWEELSSAAATRIAVVPNDATARFARGLAAHRRGNYPVATTAFEHALGLLDATERDRVTNLSRILGPKDSLAYVATSANRRAEFERLYWTAADPMTLTADNEHRLEFLARVAYSDLRWTSEDFVLRGADSDRGEIHIRYGPPPVIVSLAPQIGGAVGHVMWYYPATNLHMIFRQPPSYGYATYAFEYHEEAREARYVAPVGWTNVPITVAMDSVEVQAVRFRGSGDSTDLALFAHVPIRRLVDGLDLTSGTVDVAFTLYRGGMRAMERDSVRQIVDTRAPDAVERRTWRRRLAPGEVAYRIEALQAEGGAAARAFGSVSLTSDRGFGMSDVLVADRVTPSADSAYRWTDLLIEPSAGLLEPGQDIGVAWETYGLTERDGQVGYRVELQLTVTQVTGRKSLYARIKGGLADLVGLSALGTDRVSLVYDRSRPASDVALDYLTLDLSGSPAGRYRLTVLITDLVTNAQTFSDRELVIEPMMR
jgi:GWxTD domain-containing protein